MLSMQRPPLTVAALMVLSCLGWALVLAFGSGPLAGSAAVLLAVDLLLLGTVIAVGIVLARGRWTRWAGFVLLGGQAVLGIFYEADGWWIAAVAATAVSCGGLAGPWLDGWLRRLPRADGPPPPAVILSLGLLGLPALVAVTAPGGVTMGGWLLSGLAILGAWGYSQGWLPALWALRGGLPLLGVTAVAPLPWLEALVLGPAVAMLTALAWSPEVQRATLTTTRTAVDPVAIPPELAPPEVLEAAGLDDHGRPRQQGEA